MEFVRWISESRDHFAGALIFMVIFSMSVAHIVDAVRGETKK